MPIKVKCSCGQEFKANDDLAGKTVKCPKCTRPLTIPSPPAPSGGLSDMLDDAGLQSAPVGGVQCPSCGSAMQADAVMCIQCGYNHNLGRRMETQAEGAPRVGGHGAGAQALLDNAMRELENEPVKQDQGYGSAGGDWLMFGGVALGAAIIIGIGFVAFRAIEAADNSNRVSALVMLGLGWTMYAVGRIWLIILGFMENAMSGLGCIICECYAFIFGFTRWDAASIPTLLMIIGIFMTSISAALSAFAAAADKKTGLILPERPAHVQMASASELYTKQHTRFA